MERIAILAGGGTLPLVLADCIAERGGRAHLVGVRGEAGASIETYPHTWVTWGAVSAIIATLKRESNGQIMIAGHVSRPDLRRLKPDFGVIRYLPQVLSMLKGGDDAVLTRLVRFFEAQGLAVKGVADIAPQLLANLGEFGAPAVASEQRATDCALGFRVLDTLADLDVGQAVAVEQGRILAIEGVEGTDRMLTRIVNLPGRAPGTGVLVKGPKRGQDLRVDMPAVGAQTIHRLAEAQLGSLVIVAGKTLLLERAEMLHRAGESGITIQAVAHAAVAPQAVPAVDLRQWCGPQLGRLSPAGSDTRDACTAATVIRRLTPFGSGQAAVVVRDHVLAIAAAESPAAMARRVALLRHWGRGRFQRSLGVAAIAASAIGDGALLDMIEGLGDAGIAGVAVVNSDNSEALNGSIPAAAIAAADRFGMFLVALGVPPVGRVAGAA